MMNDFLDAKQNIYIRHRVNKLSLAKRAQILSMLCKGSSMPSTRRAVDMFINT
jgi:hypothetical protein